jgi:hypothetical protein
MGFFLRYLATALIGTLVIYYGLPNLSPHLPAVIRSMRQAASAETSVFPRRAPVPAREPAPTEVLQAAAAETPRPPAGSAIAESPASGATVVNETASKAVPAADPEPIVITELGYTPSTRRIRSSGAEVTHWGVTLLQAPFFEKDGKRREETLPGGTLVEQVSAKKSSRGEMALCRIWSGSAWAGPYLIATADLIRFPGGRDEVDADALKALMRYAALNARVEARKKELARLGVDANPHAAPLRALKTRYDAAKTKADELTRKRDQTKGIERIRLGDELRKLKEQEPRMRQELTVLTRQYEAWKSNHTVQAADPFQDAEVRGLMEQMQAMLPRLRNFGL